MTMFFIKMNDLRFFRIIYPLFDASVQIYPDSSLKTVRFGDDRIDKKSKFILLLKRFLTLSQLLRILFASICFGWFCYNAHKIIKQYLEYNTIVMLHMRRPMETDLPAVTICGPFIIDDEKLEETIEEYKANKFNLLKGNKNYSVIDERLKIRDLRDDSEANAIKQFSALYIFRNLSLNINDLVTDCFYAPNVLRDRWAGNSSDTIAIECSEIGPIIPSIYEGRKCFTFFSQLNITVEERKNIKMVYENNPSISMKISAQHNVWPVGPIGSATIIVAIHPPNIIPTHLEFDYFRIYPNKFYEVRFTKKIEYLKPPPYKTNCRDYYKTNPKGERSRGDCINNCIKRETFSVSGCANYYGILTPDLFSPGEYICERKLQNYTIYTQARRKCMRHCQSSCIEESFDVLAYEIDELDVSQNSSEEIDAIIEIKSYTHPTTIIYHREEMTDTEFVGTLGGHAGIWLGLSAITLFNFIVDLITKKKISIT